jgi:hypothetical protein
MASSCGQLSGISRLTICDAAWQHSTCTNHREFSEDMDTTLISKPTTGRPALVACHGQVRGTPGVMDGTVSGRLIG